MTCVDNFDLFCLKFKHLGYKMNFEQSLISQSISIHENTISIEYYQSNQSVTNGNRLQTERDETE